MATSTRPLSDVDIESMWREALDIEPSAPFAPHATTGLKKKAQDRVTLSQMTLVAEALIRVEFGSWPMAKMAALLEHTMAGSSYDFRARMLRELLSSASREQSRHQDDKTSPTEWSARDRSSSPSPQEVQDRPDLSLGEDAQQNLKRPCETSTTHAVSDAEDDAAEENARQVSSASSSDKAKTDATTPGPAESDKQLALNDSVEPVLGYSKTVRVSGMVLHRPGHPPAGARPPLPPAPRPASILPLSPPHTQLYG